MRQHSLFRFPARYATLVWVVALFVLISFVMRIVLQVFEGDPANLAHGKLAP